MPIACTGRDLFSGYVNYLILLYVRGLCIIRNLSLSNVTLRLMHVGRRRRVATLVTLMVQWGVLRHVSHQVGICTQRLLWVLPYGCCVVSVGCRMLFPQKFLQVGQVTILVVLCNTQFAA